jgi:hypothetical protein
MNHPTDLFVVLTPLSFDGPQTDLWIAEEVVGDSCRAWGGGVPTTVARRRGGDNGHKGSGLRGHKEGGMRATTDEAGGRLVWWCGHGGGQRPAGAEESRLEASDEQKVQWLVGELEVGGGDEVRVDVYG